MAKGLPDKEIAAALGLTLHGLRGLKRKLFARLKISTVRQAIVAYYTPVPFLAPRALRRPGRQSPVSKNAYSVELESSLAFWERKLLEISSEGFVQLVYRELLDGAQGSPDAMNLAKLRTVLGQIAELRNDIPVYVFPPESKS